MKRGEEHSRERDRKEERDQRCCWRGRQSSHTGPVQHQRARPRRGETGLHFRTAANRPVRRYKKGRKVTASGAEATPAYSQDRGCRPRLERGAHVAGWRGMGLYT